MNRLLFGFLLLTACGREVTAPATALIVTANISPSTFRAGDSVTVTVTVVNHSDVPQSIQLNQCNRPFVVSTSAGAVVGPDPLACFAYSEMMALAPGAKYSWSVPWFGRGSVPESTPTLIPGTYVVTGKESIREVDNSASMSLVPTTIQVTP